VRDGAAPDFVLSDYRLRGAHSGVDAVRMVREAAGVELPACLISGDTAEVVRQQVQSAGLVLLQKPVRPAKLRSVLRHAFLSRAEALPMA
jgi:CheY-like chemotaxis protein